MAEGTYKLAATMHNTLPARSRPFTICAALLFTLPIGCASSQTSAGATASADAAASLDTNADTSDAQAADAADDAQQTDADDTTDTTDTTDATDATDAKPEPPELALLKLVSLAAPLALHIDAFASPTEGCDWTGDGVLHNQLGQNLGSQPDEPPKSLGQLLTDTMVGTRTFVWLPSVAPGADAVGQPLVVSWHETLVEPNGHQTLFKSSLVPTGSKAGPTQTLSGAVTADGFVVEQLYDPAKQIWFWMDAEASTPGGGQPYWQQIRAIRAKITRHTDGTFEGLVCFAVEMKKVAQVYASMQLDLDTDGDGELDSMSGAMHVTLTPTTIHGVALAK